MNIFSCNHFYGVIKKTAKEYSRIIALKPEDSMGLEFSMIFGDFLKNNIARENNFRSLSHKAFTKRLELAKKYKTNFASHMEQNWDNPGVKTIFHWRERIDGKANELSWSFGIKDHTRADSVWKKLKDIGSSYRYFGEQINTAHFPYAPEVGVKRVKTFKFEYGLNDNSTLEFKIYKYSNTHYYIQHAAGKDIPDILNRLELLWKNVFHSNLNNSSKLKNLAEFEWLWFWTNPYGRSGALVGDILSILLQEELQSQGIMIKMRKTFEFKDLDALSMNLDDYIKFRVQEF